MARTLTGRVSSDKGDKTIVVSVATRKTHPLYRKQYTVTTKFMAHDEKNEAKVGDEVIITESRPISARKRFALTQIVERAGIEHVEVIPEVLVPKVKEAKVEEPEVVVEEKATEEVVKPAAKAKKTTKVTKEDA